MVVTVSRTAKSGEVIGAGCKQTMLIPQELSMGTHASHDFAKLPN